MITGSKKLTLMANDFDLYSNIRILDESKSLGIDVNKINLSDFNFSLSRQRVEDGDLQEIIWARSSGLNFDDVDLDLLIFMQSADSRFVNNPEQIKLFREKLSGTLELNRLGFPTLPTMVSRGLINKDGLVNWDGPYVVKNNRGLGGKGIFLFSDFVSLQSFAESRYFLKDEKYIIQPLIKVKEEYRLFYLDGDLFQILKRKPNDREFRANWAQGGSAEVIDQIPAKIEGGHHIAKNLRGLRFFSIEFLLDENENLFCLEVNTAPGFEEIEKLTGENLVKKVVEQFSRQK